MTERHLSKEEAQKRLEEAAKGFDWVSELLGSAKEDLLTGYRTLHAQLKEGNRLEIRVEKKTHECRSADMVYPCFEIVHVLSNGKTRVVATYSSGWSTTAALPLYNE